MQTADPVVPAKVPIEQAVHAAAARMEYMPRAQLRQAGAEPVE